MIPQGRGLETALNNLIYPVPIRHTRYFQAEGHIVMDGKWKWIGALENHAHALSQSAHIRAGIIDVFPLQENRSRHTNTGDQVIHPV